MRTDKTGAALSRLNQARLELFKPTSRRPPTILRDLGPGLPDRLRLPPTLEMVEMVGGRSTPSSWRSSFTNDWHSVSSWGSKTCAHVGPGVA